MARTSQNVQVGKRKIELSNLEKMLFPEDQILKAELIHYYLQIAPTILSHIKGRPLSLVRYPNGIAEEAFFQKNRPEWAPDWIEYITLGEEKKDYIIATEEASLVWLANLACIELHQMHSHKPHFDKPDYMVFDLDPPENYLFKTLVELTFELREHIESFGYHTFAKTTGGKGIHVVVPIEPQSDFRTVFEAAQSVATPFVEAHPKDATLHIKKDSRKGRVLIDIYRNRQSQSIISPYSVRGRSRAPVSMPLHWEQLRKVEDPSDFNIHTIVDQVRSEGDAWEGMAAYSAFLHTQPRPQKKVKSVRPSRTYKTPEKLEKYAKKRSFSKTPEPQPELEEGFGHSFVVHRHHASRLHYDLRLESNGTLKSWAVPRGLPPNPGIKRLAVAVEDHPMKYLDFEGEIPKGEYGGGMMWKFARGRYEITKEKKNGFYFRLQSPQITGEYRTYQTKDNEWLLERIDNPQVNWLQDIIEPMLAESKNKPPDSEDFIFEVKWDGIRAMISLDEEGIRIRSRSQRDITKYFPELLVPDKAFRASCGLFDAEIVYLEEGGKPNFKKVVGRLHHNTEQTINHASSKFPVVCYVFDCLYLDGRTLVNEPLTRRHEWLNDVMKKNTPYRISEWVTEGAELFEATKKLGLEGIIAKEKSSKYYPGKRTASWLKVKVRQTTECLIIGYTEGKGERKSLFGALHIAISNGKGLNYVGKVGTGFDVQTQRSVFSKLKKIKRIDRPIKEKPVDDIKSTWIEPKLICEVQYASITKNGTFREPVFIRLRPDLMTDE
jgi:bifunctional non-homologous end joining protein LigD